MQAYHTEYSKRAAGHYSPAVRAGDLLYISGQLSTDPVTGKPAGDVETECLQALQNVQALLDAAGLTREHIILCRVYVPDVALWPRVNDVYAEFFGAHKPARVVVPTGPLHSGCLVEIEAVASFTESGIPQ